MVILVHSEFNHLNTRAVLCKHDLLLLHLFSQIFVVGHLSSRSLLNNTISHTIYAHTGNVRVILNHVRPFRFWSSSSSSSSSYFHLHHCIYRVTLHTIHLSAYHVHGTPLGLSFLVRRQSHRFGSATHTHTHNFSFFFPSTYCPEICYALYSFEYRSIKNTSVRGCPPGNLSGRGIMKLKTKKDIKK